MPVGFYFELSSCKEM